MGKYPSDSDEFPLDAELESSSSDEDQGEKKKKEHVSRSRTRSRSRSKRGNRRSATRSRSRTPRRGRRSRSRRKYAEIEDHPVFKSLMKDVKDMAERLKGMNKSKRLKYPEPGLKARGMSNQPKSPSDTTLYAPALRKLTKGLGVGHSLGQKPNEDTINHYLSQLRLGGDGRQSSAEARKTDDEDQQYSSDTDAGDPGLEDYERRKRAREVVERVVVEAEKFKATMVRPKGWLSSIKENPYYEGGIEDNQFIQVISHVDEQLVLKIEQGEYVDLRKLRISYKLKQNESQRYGFQIKNDDGNSYLVPTSDEGEQKINHACRFEQAFRVYTTIYTTANPDRAPEIWQYVDTINRAATTYLWENVVAYDFQFRHLMAKNPRRSWNCTCTEMWNLTLLAPLSGRTAIHGSTAGGSFCTKRKEGYCWRFNKGSCKFGDNCRFKHRCSYCNSSSHGASKCYRKNGKKDEYQSGGSVSTHSQSKKK